MSQKKRSKHKNAILKKGLSQIDKISAEIEENFMGNNLEKKIQWIFIIEVSKEFLRHPVLAQKWSNQKIKSIFFFR